MTNRTVETWWGEECVLTIDDEGYGIIDEAAIMAFTNGQCHALAIAIHRLTKWTIKGVNWEYEGISSSPSHCIVYVSELKVYVDIRGVKTRLRRDQKIVNRAISARAALKLEGYRKPDVDAAIPFAKTLIRRVEKRKKATWNVSKAA